MPSDLTVRAVPAVPGPSDNSAEHLTATFTAPAVASPPQTGPPVPNPSFHLDAELGLMVIEFRDAAGNVTTSIPTQAQIDAYRKWGEPLPGRATNDSEPHAGKA